MKKVLLAALMMGATLGAQAQSEWFKNVKFSGYGMVQYQASDKDGAESNAFNLRLVRMALEGRAHEDFYWKVQMQINGNTYDPDNAGKTDIRLVDLFGEWQKYEFFKVKAGQFKRPFTFENPMHPITQGFMSYSQNVSKLAGFSDRCGGQASNGRDIGVQIQGDLLKNAEGRNLLHYQVGVFNGEGINQKDKDNRKDIIGGMWVMPIKGMRIGAFGWTGSRAGVGEKNRYALSGEYTQNDWTFRTEYIHSQGWNESTVRDGTKNTTATKPMVSMPSALLLSRRTRCMLRLATTSIVRPILGMVLLMMPINLLEEPRLCTKSVPTTCSPRTCKSTWSMPA